jgi:hypothetical protein
VLEDFVRWRSPADWIKDSDQSEGGAQDDGGKTSSRGRLSERLCEPDHLWTLLWGATLAVPAAEQRPLLNSDRHALEALDYLEALSAEQLLPELVYLTVEAVLATLAASPILEIAGPSAMAMLGSIGRKARTLFDRRAPPDVWQEELLEMLSVFESQLERAGSLAAKIPSDPQLVRAMLDDHPKMQREVAVGDNARPALQQRLNLASSNHTLPNPDVREYILRARAQRPLLAGSMPTAQRMYVALQEDQFRLAIALSVDYNS